MTRKHHEIAVSSNGVATLTIANAGKANILGSAVIKDLTTALDALGQDCKLRAVVLTSPGDKSFVAGADLAEMKDLCPESARAFIIRLRDLCAAVRNCPVPVVARINGWCLGGGLELAMASDFRIAIDHAKFAMPEVKVGIPSVIHAALMPRLIGAGRARWMLMTGAVINAETALNWGLIDQVAAPGELDDTVTAALAPVLGCGAGAIRAQKRLINRWDEVPLSVAIDESIEVFGRAFTTGEPKKAMQAFFDAKAR